MDLSRRCRGSAERKTARVSRRWQAAMLRLPASVQGAHGSDGLPIAVQPPSPAGIGAFRPHSATPARVGCKKIQGKPRKKTWISLDSFGGIGAFQRVTAKTREKIRRGLNSRIRLRATGSAPSESVDRQLVSTERYIPCFWICQRIGLRPSARRSDQDEPRGSRRQMSFRPGGDAVRGSSSVVVRLATTLPPSLF